MCSRCTIIPKVNWADGTEHNVAPLIPIEAKGVMERNQIDLVDMQSLCDVGPGTKYKYVLSVIDVLVGTCS